MPTATEVQEPQIKERARGWEAVRVPRTAAVLRIPPLPLRPLFADSLLDSGDQERNRRRFATLLSFTFQCLLIGTLLIVPLMFTEALPKQQLLTFLVAPPPPPPPPPAAEAVVKVVKQIQSDLLSSGQLRTPSRIPEKVQMIREEEAPPPLPSMGGVVGGVPGGIPGGQLGGVIGGIISQTSSLTAAPKLALPQPRRVRISQGVTRGLLIQKIEPKYPPLALQARIWGQVVLKAIIGKNGDIKELELVSGHPVLAPAAIEAVKEWHYRPYLLNGEPVEVETIVTVNFQISQ
ncbi:MAG TPA: energy transducer TonB [Terriglobales bacterium]|nr:energy transducer TonB [Terriglobales bacterium]